MIKKFHKNYKYNNNNLLLDLYQTYYIRYMKMNKLFMMNRLNNI
jgi:hypothetical protein